MVVIKTTYTAALLSPVAATTRGGINIKAVKAKTPVPVTAPKPVVLHIKEDDTKTPIPAVILERIQLEKDLKEAEAKAEAEANRRARKRAAKARAAQRKADKVIAAASGKWVVAGRKVSAAKFLKGNTPPAAAIPSVPSSFAVLRTVRTPPRRGSYLGSPSPGGNAATPRVRKDKLKAKPKAPNLVPGSLAHARLHGARGVSKVAPSPAVVGSTATSACNQCDEPFKCDQCTADYKTKAHLEGHVKSKHEGVRHDCEYCNKSYANLQDLQKHIAKFHP
ncbi:uncharacterized protein EHS24_008664 [Apiotrichum porosum]|uniref:C2H2-type domain-containing protein n=1 Tax=Apiotrichum porosum TaxID=105984 RepID=A0A427XQY2_9TREE|nr:uncharacterized protein EHS24_008664 [Apiotrichum porosum]RSH81227.1 hypothetical protein EHS24_008664 [Apiotrichum porosum]